MMQCYPLQGNVPLQKAHAPADNTAAVVTITCTSSQIIVVDSIIASYDDTATGTIVSTGLRNAQLKIHYQTTTGDVMPMIYEPPGGLYGSTDGTSVVITLSNPGAGKAGTLYVVYHLAHKAVND